MELTRAFKLNVLRQYQNDLYRDILERKVELSSVNKNPLIEPKFVLEHPELKWQYDQLYDYNIELVLWCHKKKIKTDRFQASEMVDLDDILANAFKYSWHWVGVSSRLNFVQLSYLISMGVKQSKFNWAKLYQNCPKERIREHPDWGWAPWLEDDNSSEDAKNQDDAESLEDTNDEDDECLDEKIDDLLAQDEIKYHQIDYILKMKNLSIENIQRLEPVLSTGPITYHNAYNLQSIARIILGNV